MALLAAFSLSAVAQTDPHMQPDNRVNLRAQPTTQSGILVQLDRNEKFAILGRQGNWYHVQRRHSGYIEGYIHKSQVVHLLHSYIVSSRDGYANVREAYKSGVYMDEPPIAQLRRGTRVWVYPEQSMGSWLFVTEPVMGFVHKSQLQREN